MEKSDLATRGELIRQARAKEHLPQAQVGVLWATAAGRPVPYSQAWVSDVEQGKHILLAGDLVILAEVLNIPERQLREAPAGPARTSYRLQVRGEQRKIAGGFRFGTTDVVHMKAVKIGLRLDFTASDQRCSCSVVLTKCPVPLAGALETALDHCETQEGIFPYTGENFRGRVAVFGGLRYAWVAEFASPRPAGFLIHMRREDVDTARKQLMLLPLHAFPTD